MVRRKVSGGRRPGQSERRPGPHRPGRGLPALLVLLAGLSAAASGCGRGSSPAIGQDGGGRGTRADTAPEPGPTAGPDTITGATPVLTGLDVLLRDSLGLLRNRRVGLITNHTGRSWAAPGAGPDGISAIDLLYENPDVDLVALFSPEHGIRGDVDRKVASGVDERTGLPIHSLYGETRKPTAAMLRGIDILVFDIQDIGTRYYSYVWTMALAMEASAENGLGFVVLDRPDPLGGRIVQGNVKPSYMPVAYYQTAMRHGLTAGELARYVNGEYGLGVDLHVVPMEGWRRAMWWDDTGLPWRPPSPNMPSLESATHYPGTCLFEGTNLSVGRGTDRAFQQFGAPWLDAPAIAASLRARRLPGVRIDTVRFTPDHPTDGKFAGEPVRGIRLTVTDRDRYDPVHTAVAALLEITARPSEFRWREAWFDGLAGGPRLREQIAAGAPLQDIVAPWPAQRTAFEAARRPYLLYP